MKNRYNLSFWTAFISSCLLSAAIFFTAIIIFFAAGVYRFWVDNNLIILLLLAGAIWWSHWNYKHLKGVYHFREASLKYFIILFLVLFFVFLSMLFGNSDKSTALTLLAWSAMVLRMLIRLFKSVEVQTFTSNPEEDRKTM